MRQADGLARTRWWGSTCRMILHIDMDAFYASVEQRDDPNLQGKPVIVGGPATGRGVVSAASYEAREFGVHSAMPSSRAKRLCPHGIFLPSRMSHYAEASGQIREIFFRYTPLVEPLSLDEAFLDVTGSERLFGTAAEIGKRIVQDIRKELDLPASVGVAPNKFLAKVASDLEKPHGFVVVPEEDIQGFLDPLPITRIWGIGKVTNVAFQRLGIRTISDLRELSAEALRTQFGDLGQHVWNLAHGIDHREVVPDREAKSISHETTLAVDVSDPEIIRAWILELADQVGRRMRRNGVTGRTVKLKVRFSSFKTISRSRTLDHQTDVTQEIFSAANELFNERVPTGQPIRLIGVGLAGLEHDQARQAELFGEQNFETHRNAELASDQIRDRFGHQALSFGSRLLHNTRHKAVPRPQDGEDKDATE